MGRYISAAVVSVANAAVYPLTKHLALMERGYEAHGGEDILFVFGFLAALLILIGGRERRKERHGRKAKKDGLPESNPPFTECERSTNHFDTINISRSPQGCQRKREHKGVKHGR
jgi:hypothetical protein